MTILFNNTCFIAKYLAIEELIAKMKVKEYSRVYDFNFFNEIFIILHNSCKCICNHIAEELLFN